jgi:hypothetical protein
MIRAHLSAHLMNGTFGGCWCKGDVTPVIIALQMTSEAFRRAQVLRPEPDRGFDLVNRCSQNATLAGESAVMRIPLR